MNKLQQIEWAKFLRFVGFLWCFAVGGTLLIWAVLCTIFIPNSDLYGELMLPVFIGPIGYSVLIYPYFYFADDLKTNRNNEGVRPLLIGTTCILIFSSVGLLDNLNNMAYETLLPEIRYNYLKHIVESNENA